MQVTLADIQTRPTAINKDLSGGFGTSSDFGSSLSSRLLKRAKKVAVCLPILNFGYLAALLKRRGHKVSFTEGRPVAGTDLYIVYASLVEHCAEIDFASRMRASGVKVGFVGSFASARPDLFLPHADFVIAGEPEGAFLEASDELDWSGIVTGPLVPDLDELPFPDWTPFPIERYSYSHFLPHQPFLTMAASRGCPYSCAYYCPYPSVQGRKFRMRSIERVADEMQYLQQSFGVRSVLFRDPLFSLDKERIAGLTDAIRKRDLRVEWACETHLARLDKELVDLMASSGCQGINVGIESVDPTVMGPMKRKTDESGHQEEMISYCESKRIRIGAFFIFGNPEDTKETIRSTIAYAQSLDSSFAQFTLSTPYVGTPYYDEMQAKLTETEWEKYDIYTPTFEHPNLTKDELISLKEEAFRRYYFRAFWIGRHLLRSVRRRLTASR